MLKKILTSLKFRTKRFQRQISKNENIDLKFISQNLNVNIDTIFDVGANKGETVKIFNKLFPKASIHAFEPNPTIFENLQNNCKKIQAVTFNNVGVGNVEGKLLLNRHANSGATSFKNPNIITNPTYTNKIIDQIEVPVITLQDYFKKSNITSIDLLKIDVEGFEMEVLEGISGEILKNKVKLIFIEANLVEKMLGQGLIENIISLLRTNNFTLYNIYTQQETRDRQLLIVNLLCVNNNLIKY